MGDDPGSVGRCGTQVEGQVGVCRVGGPAAGAERRESAMVEVTRGQVQDLIAGFASRSPEYRRALLAKPQDVLEAQLGTAIPPAVRVVIVEEKRHEVHLSLPCQPPECGELTDAELDAVVGGASRSRWRARVARPPSSPTRVSFAAAVLAPTWQSTPACLTRSASLGLVCWHAGSGLEETGGRS